MLQPEFQAKVVDLGATASGYRNNQGVDERGKGG